MKQIYPIILSSILLLSHFCRPLAAQVKLQDVQGFELDQEWEFRPSKQGIWTPATVPGSVQLNLLNAGLIEDPFFQKNEEKIQWIEEEDWLFQNYFQVDDELYGKEHIEILFKGLDTYADVYLNDKLILQADNMFRAWTVDIKPYIKPGKNLLRIHLHSAMKMGRAKRESKEYSLPAGNDAQDEKLSVYTRKAPFQFGWDWGPRVVTTGIWRPVEIISWNESRILDCHFTTLQIAEEKALVKAKIVIEGEANQVYQLLIRDMETGQALINREVRPSVTGVVEEELQILEPKLWWCNGLGEPHLYKLETRISSLDKRILDKQVTEIGLRTIELIQEQDSIGTSYFFKLNGVPVFMKGANYIPSDNLLARVDSARYEDLLSAAAEAHMNMLRVWGGGIYEDDLFYSICDRKGLLVWQDFMFACSMYPGDDAFLDNVGEEVKYNIKRLRNHPCIALWCGNNEMAVAWHNWGWQQEHEYSKSDSAEIWNNYQTIFHQMIPYEVLRLHQGAKYVSTSPLSNWGTLENFNHHSMHYWGVWHGTDHFEGYHNYIGRFMSEYGFQSFPSLKTVKKFSTASDWSLDSPVMKHRQKSYKGNGLIYEFMEDLLPRPESFSDFLFFSQVTQAEGLKIAFESHRAAKPHCMGTLYWQLNDCWPAISWSGIDYFGEWKALHYYAKRAFQPIVILPYEEGDWFKVKINSDLPKPAKGTLKVSLIDFAGKELDSFEKPASIDELSNDCFLEIETNVLLQKQARTECMVLLEWQQSGQTIVTNYYYFEPSKNLQLGPGKFTSELKESDGNFVLSLSSTELVKTLQLQSEIDGHFDDNYFDLLPGTTKNVTFIPTEPVDIRKFKNGLKTRSINEVIRELDRE